jgi:hypothetical protein
MFQMVSSRHDDPSLLGMVLNIRQLKPAVPNRNENLDAEIFVA